jgi:hypothetical protein
MVDFEGVCIQSYKAFCEKSPGFGGLPWQNLSANTRDAWRNAIAAALKASAQPEPPPTPPPLFAASSNFDTPQLEDFRKVWRRIKTDPQWAFWHNHAPRELANIEAELARRR